MHKLLIVLSLLSLLATPVLAQDAAPASTSVELQLLSPGEAPLTPLRYNLRAVREQAVRMDMDTTMGMGMGGQTFDQAMPTIRTNATVRSPALDADGNLSFDFVTGDMSIIAREGQSVDPAVEAALASALDTIAEVRGVMLVDDRGQLLRSEFDLSDTTDPQSLQMLDSTMQTAQQSVVPFPLEPVGVGARWSATMDLMASGMNIRQTVTYELLEFEGSTARIVATISQTADNQQLSLPELPPDASAELVGHTGSGTSTMLVRLDRIMPTGSFDMNTASTLRYSSPGESADMSMTLSMSMRIDDAVEEEPN